MNHMISHMLTGVKIPAEYFVYSMTRVVIFALCFFFALLGNQILRDLEQNLNELNKIVRRDQTWCRILERLVLVLNLLKVRFPLWWRQSRILRRLVLL